MSNDNKLKTFNVEKIKKRKLEAFKNLVRQDELAPVNKKKKSVRTFEQSYKALKDELRKYQEKKCSYLTLKLKASGRCALVDFLPNSWITNSTKALFFEDIHHLLLMSVLGVVSPYPLRWAELRNARDVSKTVLIEIQDLYQHNVKDLHSELQTSCNFYPFLLEIISSGIPFATDLCTMHLIGDLNNQTRMDYSSVFPVNEPPNTKIAKPTLEYNFSKLYLLLNPIQMAMENFPLPQDIFKQSKSDGYCFSKESYTAVHEDSPMFAVDCEMCRTTKENAVTRIAVVNENLETVYHSFVKPKEKIIDYATRYSGITEKILRNVTTTLSDVQRDIRNILPSDAILCGQSLNCDLRCLKMIHPYVIDTSIIFNTHGIRHKKTSLKGLTKIHLNEYIQTGSAGHSPIEDSVATMKLVQIKLKNSIEYGDAVLSRVSNKSNVTRNKCVEVSVKEKDKASAFVKLNDQKKDNKKKINDLKLNDDDKRNGFFSRLLRFSKKVCLIGSEKSLDNYYPELLTENVKVIETKNILKTTADNIEKCDLILSHLSIDNKNYPFTELKNEIKQIYTTIPEKALVILLMSGVNKHNEILFKHNYCMLSIKE